MATESQIQANQANSKHSTGPTSVEGKARVAQNAVRHGLSAKNPIVHGGEQAAFDALRAGLLAEIDPQGAVETATFNELLHAAWNLHRFRVIEAGYANVPFDDPKAAAELDRLSRYQVRAQRAYYRALQEIRTLQTNRALREATFDDDGESKPPALANMAVLAKQSRSGPSKNAISEQLEREGQELERQLKERTRQLREAGGLRRGNTSESGDSAA
jgi:hypothetical protein